MLKNNFKKTMVCGVLSLVVSVTSTIANAQTTLTAALPVPVDTVWGRMFVKYIDSVKEVSNGDLKIRVVGPESIPGSEQMGALRSGLIDILSTFPGAYRNDFPEANVQEISNVSLAEQKENGSYDKLKTIFDQRFDAELLATYGEELGFHIYLLDEIKTQKDMESVRIRTSVLQAPLLRSLKAQLIDIPIPEVFTALERNLVDGYSFSNLGIGDMGWDGMTKYRIDPQFYNIIFNVFLSNKSKSKLSETELGYLRQAASNFEEAISADLLVAADKEYARQESIGIKSIDFGADYAELARKVYWDELTANSELAVEFKKLMDK